MGSLSRRCGFGKSRTDNQAGRQQHVRLPSGGGREREERGGGRVSREAAKERRGILSDGITGGGGAAARRGRQSTGIRAPLSPSINRVGEESGNDGDESEHNNSCGDSDALGVEEREPYRQGGSGSGCGSGRAWTRGAPRADGLAELTRQVALVCPLHLP